jgi:3'-phosphoadenosine 5'-phosphosulfate sulfotransferase (PAPS reductase)/FAD synthetase
MEKNNNLATIVVWFSCGAASAVAAKKTIELYGDKYNIRVVNNPIKEEHPDNQRFLRDVEKWIGKTIEFAINSKFPDQSCETVWEKRKYMAGIKGAPCTFELKKKARQEWEAENRQDYLVLGFTAEEKTRFERFKLMERDNILPVLIEAGITKDDCFAILNDAGIDLPEIYKLGYPNANCIGCVKSTSPTYWNHVRKVHPDVFNARALQSREVGARLVRHKGQRIFLDELDPTVKGQKMKNMHVECGIFCGL